VIDVPPIFFIIKSLDFSREVGVMDHPLYQLQLKYSFQNISEHLAASNRRRAIREDNNYKQSVNKGKLADKHREDCRVQGGQQFNSSADVFEVESSESRVHGLDPIINHWAIVFRCG